MRKLLVALLFAVPLAARAPRHRFPVGWPIAGKGSALGDRKCLCRLSPVGEAPVDSKIGLDPVESGLFQLWSDIVETVLAPAWEDIGKLGAIAVIPAFLSHSLTPSMNIFYAFSS